MRCGMRLPYALVLEFIGLLKSYSSAEMTAMGRNLQNRRSQCGGSFSSISTLGPLDSFGCPTGAAWLCPKGLAIRY